MPAGVSRAHRPHAVSPGNKAPAAPQLRVVQAGSCPFVQTSESSPDPETLQIVDESTSQASMRAPTASNPRTGSRHAPARGVASPPRIKPEGGVGEGKAGVRQALELNDFQVDNTPPPAIGRTPSATRPQTATGGSPPAIGRTQSSIGSPPAIGRTQSAIGRSPSSIVRSPSAAPDAHHHNFTEAQLESYQVLSVRIRDADARLRLKQGDAETSLCLRTDRTLAHECTHICSA